MDVIIAFALGMVTSGVAYLVIVWPTERGRWRRGYMCGYMEGMTKREEDFDGDTSL